MNVPSWFLYVTGFSLVLLGVMQIQARPRRPNATLYERFVNVGTLWSLVCIAVGTCVVLMALGWLTPFDRAPPSPPAARKRH
jgi:hypothetical protein